MQTPSVILLLHWYKNRRRTFDPADEEENAGMEHTSERKKYVYREIEPADLVLGMHSRLATQWGWVNSVLFTTPVAL